MDTELFAVRVLDSEVEHCDKAPDKTNCYVSSFYDPATKPLIHNKLSKQVLLHKLSLFSVLSIR